MPAYQSITIRTCSWMKAVSDNANFQSPIRGKVFVNMQTKHKANKQENRNYRIVYLSMLTKWKFLQILCESSHWNNENIQIRIMLVWSLLYICCYDRRTLSCPLESSIYHYLRMVKLIWIYHKLNSNLQIRKHIALIIAISVVTTEELCFILWNHASIITQWIHLFEK